MKKARMAGVIVGFLVCAGLANAGTTTVESTFDYSTAVDFDGTWFIPPDVTLDHSPYYRGMWEDWGWTHSLKDLVPSDAQGIQAASLEIYAWDVDMNDEEGAEIDIIYADNVELGALNDTDGRHWGATTFELPPAVLESLWADGEVYVYIDIDTIRDFAGQRVTLGYAKLTVEYTMPSPGEVARLPVYRFWSPILQSHFYTALESEKEKLLIEYPDVWTYDGEVYQAVADANEPNSAPIYRFWSNVLGGHFYTISEKERDRLIEEHPDVWDYEGIAFHAYPVDQQPAETIPIYRFWSDALATHFYTADEAERDHLLKDSPDLWTYDGIAWYAYSKEEEKQEEEQQEEQQQEKEEKEEKVAAG
ncbi:MAG: hypothetical protein JSW27_26040 [Phycisphaerales bacterium]|nr:MAG: hypothetical protein JSW27_26040 [Phycisphaerales bacterium]